MGMNLTWKWSDRAKEYLVIFRKEGAEAAAAYASKFKRLDKLRDAITKEINDPILQRQPTSGPINSPEAPIGTESPVSMEVREPSSEHPA